MKFKLVSLSALLTVLVLAGHVLTGNTPATEQPKTMAQEEQKKEKPVAMPDRVKLLCELRGNELKKQVHLWGQTTFDGMLKEAPRINYGIRNAICELEDALIIAKRYREYIQGQCDHLLSLKLANVDLSKKNLQLLQATWFLQLAKMKPFIQNVEIMAKGMKQHEGMLENLEKNLAARSPDWK